MLGILVPRPAPSCLPSCLLSSPQPQPPACTHWLLTLGKHLTFPAPPTQRDQQYPSWHSGGKRDAKHWFPDLAGQGKHPRGYLPRQVPGPTSVQGCSSICSLKEIHRYSNVAGSVMTFENHLKKHVKVIIEMNIIPSLLFALLLN